MTTTTLEQPKYLINIPLLIGILILLLIGEYAVFSTTALVDVTKEANMQGALTHLNHIVIGVMAAVCAFFLFDYLINYPNLRYLLICTALFVSIVLLFMTLTSSFGKTVNNSSRWVQISGSFSFQPVAIVKILFIFYYAEYIAKNLDNLKHRPLGVKHFFTNLLHMCWIPLLIIVLLHRQPDNGNIMVIGSIMLGMIFLCRIHFSYFSFLLLAAMGFGFYSFRYFQYLQLRWEAFIDPIKHFYNEGYQAVHSMIAIKKGGWTGVGIGDSKSKLGYLPETDNDFIFTVIGEELGSVVLIALVLIYCYGFIIMTRIARKSIQNKHIFAGFCVYGIAISLTMQSYWHMGVNVGVVPINGITLPLVSSGGSSIVTTLTICGVLFAADKLGNRRKP